MESETPEVSTSMIVERSGPGEGGKTGGSGLEIVIGGVDGRLSDEESTSVDSISGEHVRKGSASSEDDNYALRDGGNGEGGALGLFETDEDNVDAGGSDSGKKTDEKTSFVRSQGSLPRLGSFGFFGNGFSWSKVVNEILLLTDSVNVGSRFLSIAMTGGRKLGGRLRSWTELFLPGVKGPCLSCEKEFDLSDSILRDNFRPDLL